MNEIKLSINQLCSVSSQYAFVIHTIYNTYVTKLILFSLYFFSYVGLVFV